MALVVYTGNNDVGVGTDDLTISGATSEKYDSNDDHKFVGLVSENSFLHTYFFLLISAV